MRTFDLAEYRAQALPSEAEILAGWGGEIAPLISVVCITYNQRPYIEDAIRGILSQKTSFPYEVLIQDDVSSDGTRIILAEYASRYPRIIRLLLPDTNLYRRGIRPTFHAVLSAKSQFIALCEGDDYWIDPEKLQKQFMAIGGSSDVMLVHSAGLRQDENGFSRVDYSGPADFESRQSAAASLMRGNSVLTATALYRRKVFEELRHSKDRLNPHWPFGDYPLALQAVTMGNVVKLRNATAVYRAVGGSLTNRGRESHLRMHKAAHECRVIFSKYMPIQPETAKDLLIQSAQRLIFLCAIAGDVESYKSVKNDNPEAFSKMGLAMRINSTMLVRFPAYRTLQRVARKQLSVLKALYVRW